MEFALVVVPFLFLLLAGTDLARFFASEQQLQTVTSEAARACFVLAQAGESCVGIQVQVEASAPLLNPGLVVSASYGPPDPVTNVTTVTASSTFPFTFVLPIWTRDNSTLSAKTTLAF
jgi:Flp pilus assembly protein TadG